MKKLLALVLALVMSMSLVTISNAAFKDADKIDYKEAVDVMNAVGVFIGDEKGNFNAKENLTREQAAKIIAYLELGEKAADTLVGSATFTDVAATRWSAGFVSYCAQAGVVSGYDGKFDPAGQLTALQFGKMLLVEIGYDAKAAGMVGTDWAINTSKLLATTGLMNGIDGSVNQVLTREKAAQMCLNALKTPTVEYATKGSNITVNGAEINFGASVPTYVTNTVAKEQTISKDKLTNSGEYTIELGEKLYKDLKLVKDTTDAFERPTHEWYLKTTKIGAYAEAADLEYTKSVKTGTIYSDLGLSKGIDDSKVTYFIDGENKSADWTWDIVKGDITNKVGGNGAQTFVYYNDDAKTVKVVVINTYVAKVAAAYKATTTKDAYVSLNTTKVGMTFPAGASGFTFDTDAFAKDDIVAYTYSFKTGEGVQSMYLAEKVTGKMSTYTTTGSVTVDGTKYDASTKSAANISGFVNSVDRNTEVSVYLDQFGYGLYVDADVATNYAVILDYAGAARLESARAKLLFTDGTVKKVDIKEVKSALGDFDDTPEDSKIDKYDIVSYTVNSDNEYTLTLVADSQTTSKNTNFKLKNGDNEFYFSGDKKANVAGANKTKFADGETIFLVADVTNASNPIYSVYTGFANVPTTTVADPNTIGTVFFKGDTNNTAADVVFLLKQSNVTMTSDNKDVIFVKGSSVGETYTTADGKYWQYDAIINGTETTIKSNIQYTKDTLGYGPQYTTKGILSSFEDYAGANGDDNGSVGYTTNTYAPVNNTIQIGSRPYAIASDCVAYMLDTEYTLSQIDVTSITDKTGDEIYFKTNDKGQVSVIFIHVVDAAGSVGGDSSYVFTSGDSAVVTGTAAGSVKFTNTTGTVIKGTAAAITDLTVKAEAYARDTNQKWVLVSEASAATSVNASGILATTGDIATALTAGSYRVTLTLTGADVGTLVLGSYTVTIA